MERRLHERYGLKAPVSFSWRNSRYLTQRSKGLLLNISGGGVFVATHDLPPKGTRIRISASLRTAFAGADLVIRANAELIRLELCAGDGMTGFAAVIKTFTLRNELKAVKGHATADMVPKKRKT